MNHTFENLLAVVIVLACPTLALAQDATSTESIATEQPMATDRPDFTEGPTTVAPGRFQLEGGFTYERSGSARATSAGEVLARIGLNQRSELRIGVPSYLSVRDGGKTSGLDDASLGVKYELSQHPERPLAVIVGTTLPTGSRRVSERKLQPEVILAAGLDLSDKVDLGLGVGYGRPSGGGVRFNQVFGSAVLGFSLSEQVGAFAEVFAFNRTEAGGRTQKYSDFGFTYALSDNLQLDARVGLGLWNRAGGPDYFYGVGASQRF